MSDVLDQSDIDKLLQEASAEAQGVVYKASGGKFGGEKGVKVEAYDFRNPVFLTEVEMRQVRFKYDDFVKYLSAKLSLFFRMEVKMKMSPLQTMVYSKLTESMKEFTYISMVSIGGLTGVILVGVKPRLGLTMVNRMLGGKGHSVKEERGLTPIEMTLMDEVVYILMEEWCKQWKEFRQMEGQIIGSETDAKYLQTAPHDAMLLVSDLEVQLGDCVEMVKLAVPYLTVEPLVKEMQAKALKFNKVGQKEKGAKWLDIYSEIKVPVYAEWRVGEVSVRDALNLRLGDVLELPREMIENTQVRLMNTACFSGEIGLDKERVVVKLSKKIINQEENHE